MKSAVFCVVFLYFFLGAIGIFFINRKSTDQKEKAGRWLKYFIYAIIVNGIVSSLAYDTGFVYIAISIIILGLYEIITVWKSTIASNISVLLFAIAVFSLFGFGFLQYSFLNDNKKLLVYILVFTFDGFSQITGQLFGKHKLAPAISPNKTIEGLSGGYITSIITAIIVGHWFGFSFVGAIGFALLIGTASLTGDLAASWYKRICHVKDYGNLIPGHGGVLDRFDSFIFAACVYWLMTL